MAKLDVIIIGAGAAGLACGRLLREQGLRVLILEARARIGGRILSQYEDGLETPLELGAEFLHAAPPKELLRHIPNLQFENVLDRHLISKNGQLRENNDFFEQLGRIFEKLRADRKTDQSLRQFIQSSKVPAAKKALVKAYIEGFHAASVDLMGEKALVAAEQSERENINGVENFRFVRGYTPWLQSFLWGKSGLQECIRFRSRVKKIHWQKNQVEVHCHARPDKNRQIFRARFAVVTVPIGVLKAPSDARAHIEFDPVPASLQKALNAIEVGHTTRAVFVFHSRFWEKILKHPLGFLHAASGIPFPTWWTTMPRHTPILTAWQGGPLSQEMSQWPEERVLQTALSSLATLLGVSPLFVRRQLKSGHCHNWNRDPFSLGAYSFVNTGGLRDSQRLQRPLKSTLYFAGEATQNDSSRGTVQGAFCSGERVAIQILRKLGIRG